MDAELAEFLAQTSAAHLAILTTLIRLLLSKGLITHEETLAHFESLSDQAVGNDIMLVAVSSILAFLGDKEVPDIAPAGHEPSLQ